MIQRITLQTFSFFLLCIFSLFNNSCNHSGTAGSTDEGEPARVHQTVAVASAREKMSQRIELSAGFHPYREADLNSKVKGYVKEIRVDIGDRVTEGQIVATLEVPEFSSDVEQAAAARKSSESEVLQAHSEVQRAQSVMDAARLVYTRYNIQARTRTD